MMHTLNALDCVRKVPVFRSLEVDDQQQIAALVKDRDFPKGTLVYEAGAAADSLLIVSQGRLKIYQLAENGKEQLLRILAPGDFDGEYALFTHDRHTTYAEAAADTSVCRIYQADFQELLLRTPQLALNIMAELAKRITQLETQTTRTTTEDVANRLFLYLKDAAKQQAANPFHLPLTQKDLATYLGTTPETVSRRLKELEQMGVIVRLPKRQIKLLKTDLAN
ncbi:transcription regulator [Lactobacillus selangorensis]|uniref:Transcription regulator n=1 Tax=Lactobacillus selangorensis TaxID=81857 RepID=A0A0R2FQT2_9LACO|nr:Crp/Fnr family transcriptional regulator [Lactobacillus selangorensis]KRN28245.1 transcription regulator [Lactobacillus selangorensis]KRN30879.1 transcription regulator [Lactobacillus selangorensis]